jgi:hypothetical protein
MSSKITLQHEDIFTQSVPPSGYITLGAHSDGELYRIDEYGDVSPINYGVVGPTGLSGHIGITGGTGSDSIIKFSPNSYEVGGSWYQSTAVYGRFHEMIGYIGSAPFYNLTYSTSNQTWMYEHVIDVGSTLIGIGSFLGNGNYRLFIYDSDSTSNGSVYPNNLLYESSTFSMTTGYKEVTGFTVSLSPGVYWIGWVFGSQSTVHGISPNAITSILGNGFSNSSLSLIPYCGYGLSDSVCDDWYNNGMPSTMGGSMSLSSGIVPNTNGLSYPNLPPPSTFIKIY